MFRAIWSKTLRDYRVPILSWGIGLGLLMAVGFATATPIVLIAFASLVPLVSFLGEAYAMHTPAGYITFRYMETTLPLLLSFWPILAGVRLSRGEEERGSMDVLLATPHSRTRILLEKIAALGIALILIAVLLALGAAVGESKVQQVDFLGALLAGLNLGLLTFFFGMVALLLSQLTISRGAASGGASGLLIIALLLNIAGREIKGSWLQYLSPFYYYNLDRPFLPTFQDQPLGALVLAILSAVCVFISLALFVRRDVGGAAFVWQRQGKQSTRRVENSLSQAERAISTRSISLRTLAAQGLSSFWWLLGIVIFCSAILFITPSFQKPFYNVVQQTPWLAALFFDTPTNTNTALLGTIIFTFMPALVVVFALTLALPWSSDMENGRMELIFSTPPSRYRVLLERFGVSVLLLLLAPVLTWLAITIGALSFNLNVNQSHVLAASFSMLPPALITISLVYALAGRLRYVTLLSILTAYLTLSYLEESLEGAIQMPNWLMSLSIFHLYGNPIFLGINWTNFLGMLGVALVLLLIGLFQFRSVDIKTG